MLMQDEGQIRQNMFQLQSIFHFRIVKFESFLTRIHDSSQKLCKRFQCPIDFDYNSECGILWFITNDVGGYSFRVAFDSKSDSPLWISEGTESGGRRLHVFMWASYSKCFMEYSKRFMEFSEMVPRLGNSCELWLSFDCDASVSELDKVLVGGLWLPMHYSMSGVLFKKIIAKFAPKSSWSVASLSGWIKGSLMS